MENSAIKIVSSILNSKDFKNLKKYINKKTILFGIFIFFFFIFGYFLIKPYFYDYNSNVKLIENKIFKQFKVNTKIIGNINYKILPSPRITIKKVGLKLEKKNEAISLEEINIFLPIFHNNKFKNLDFEEFLISNMSIQVYPNDFADYFKFFTKIDKNKITLKNCKLFFLDEQKNKVLFENFNFKEKYSNKAHSISIDSIFSKNKLKIKFKNLIGGEKKLDLKLPQINTTVNILFDPSSNLKDIKGKSKIKLFDSILVLNFTGAKEFKIFESFLRNKYFNSKIEGDISFIKNFFFNLNLDVNQISLRKLLFRFLPENETPVVLNSGISKKINGTINISMKHSQSFIGRINDLNMVLVFENGDLRIKNGSAKLPHDSTIEFDLLLADNSNSPFLDFSLNFYSQNTKKFLRKFNIYRSVDKETSLSTKGKINLRNNKIKFFSIVSDKSEKFDKQDVLNIEENFNQNVLNTGILGITDFFKLKKFANELLN